jgi:DNA-binding CsgD family transcriptional regulator/PAS domain-containing protein
MREYQKIARLIGDIYDAALDAAQWTDVLTRVADFVGGQAGGIISNNSVSNLRSAHYHFGIECRYVRLYAETYWQFDPAGALFSCDVGQVVSISDLVPYDEFRRGRFYHEWARPQGWVDAAHAVLEKSATNCVYLTVIRGEAGGMVDAEMRRRMGLVVPHVRRAALIGKAIDLKQAQVAKFTDILDSLSVGILLVDAGGRIVHANTAGHGILQAADVLRAADGRLIASDAQVDQTLREAFTATESGDVALGNKGLALPLTARDGGHHIVHMLPLASGRHRNARMVCGAVAALLVRKVEMEPPSLPTLISKTFSLTPTELRVLLAIVDVGGVPEVAEALGIAETRVRTHLGRLFDKTGTGRQADLVKLVAGFCNPFVA